MVTTYKAIVVDERFTQPGNGKRRPIRELSVLLLDDEFCTRYAALCINQPSEGAGSDPDALRTHP